jgi:hypothetical protein
VLKVLDRGAPSGVRYQWDADALDAGIAPAPGWLQPVQRRKPKPIEVTTGDYTHQIEAIVDVIRKASGGQRNSCTNWAAFRLGELVVQGQISRSDAFGRLYNAAVGVGLDDDEAQAAVNSGLGAWSTA